MTRQPENLGPKVHPAEREVLPDDPMSLHGLEVPGDPDLMLRLLVEEYARMGWDLDSILQLARDPFYQAFHGLLRLYGEGELRRRVAAVLSRMGVARVRVIDTEPEPDRLVQVELPSPPKSSEDQHGNGN